MIETTDVIVCGCGPTGAMMSVLLSQYAIPHVVIERDSEINADPRGIALDEDGIRCLQACGIYNKIFTEIGQCMDYFYFIGGVHSDLSKKPFMSMRYGTTEGGTGHPGFMCHKQPSVEKNLRDQIEKLGVASLRLGSRVTSISEDEGWVYASYTDTSDESHTVRAKFLIGADGKTGFTRKQYLEPRGITLDRAANAPYEETWVALNWKISLPTPQTHPDFPLWDRGYTPQQIYDLFFPKDFRFLCNHARAAVCGRFGLTQDRLWRFEFVVLPGEDSNTMATPAEIAKVVHPCITHPGSRYGLGTQQIIYPLDCIEVLRCRPFRFSARSCNKWSLDRVLLCGDAAHVFPPFGGQGIASAFRDAISLAWRLRIATGRNAQLPQSSGAVSYQKLFQGWYSERKQQLDKSLKSTVENGGYVTESNTLKVFFRDWYLWLVQLVPAWRHWLQLGNRREGMTRYRWQDDVGMAFLPSLGGGGNFPQVYAAPLSEKPQAAKVAFTDDIIFSPEKTGLFQVVVLLQTANQIQDAVNTLEDLKENSGDSLIGEEATLILNSTAPSPIPWGDRTVYRLATADEFADDKDLCAGRPVPIGYDPFRMGKEVGHKKYVILRPDRFVFAACDTRTDLVYAAQKLRTLVETGNL